MRKFLTVLALVALAGLSWWLWKQNAAPFENGEKLILKEKTETEQQNDSSVKTKGIKRTEKTVVDMPDAPIEVEVVADENGVFLSSIGDKVVNQQITDKSVAFLDLKNGILKFWEISPETGTLKFKSINLVEFMMSNE